MSAVAETLRALASVLNASRAPWYVFGAQAVAVRGAPRATQDIDVTVIIKPGRVPQLAEALERAGLTHRFPAIKDQLLAEASVLPFTHASGMEVDLVIGASGLEELTASRATPVPIDGVEVPVASPTDLVVMKVLAGRGKDLDDVRSVIAGGQVDLDEARDLLRQLEEALDQSDLLVRLDEAADDV